VAIRIEDLTEWQQRIAEAVLRGERIVLAWSRGYGKTTVLDAIEAERRRITK
jgi:predicted ATP-binding protein involved in virulence